MFLVLTNALIDVVVERSELDLTSPWLVGGRFERTEGWINGML